MKNNVLVTTPGKLMLFGEHAVIYNRPCIVTAVDQRMSVGVRPIKGDFIAIDAPDVKIKDFKVNLSDLEDSEHPKQVKFILSSIKNFFKKHKVKSGLTISTKSEFSSLFGFGSSSAVTVGVIKALSEIFDIQLTNKELFDIAYKSVLDIQGVGSGFDIASAIWGGTLYFVGGGKVIKPINTKGLPLLVGYTGIKADTATLVKQVAELRRVQKGKIDDIFNSVTSLVEGAKKAIENPDSKELGRLMNENQKLLSELGVSSQELDSLIKASINACAYGAKLSGAGGGDCMIALTSDGNKTKVENAIKKAGGVIMNIKTNAEGVRVENKEMKAVARAPANIAFIKYWGKRNEKLRLPANTSISMNLSGAFTTTSVKFDEKLHSDTLFLNGKKASEDETKRVSKHLDLIRNMAKIKKFALIESENNFPKGAGIASSASGFAALTLAASKAAGLNLSEKELSILARLGSGSACRSIPDGFVEWKEGKKSNESYAYSLHNPEYWDLCDLIIVVGENSKKVSSTEGHAIAESSPFYKTRIGGMKNKVKEIKSALKDKDFTKFGKILEAEAINMHTVMMTSVPPLYYWTPQTLLVINKAIELREEGIECYFTIDAGPNVHIICEENNAAKIENIFSKIAGVRKVLVNKPDNGTTLT